MHPIVDLLLQIFAAGPALTLRETASLALVALGQQFPGLSVLLFERDVLTHEAVRVIAGLDVPVAWRSRRLALSEVPPVAAAMHTPQRVVQGPAHRCYCSERQRDLPKASAPHDPFQAQMVCGAISNSDNATWVIALSGCSSTDIQIRATAVEIVRKLLAWTDLAAGSAAQQARLLAASVDRLASAQEEERKRIARDLHDSVGQWMSAIKYSLERASVLVRRHETEAAVHIVDNAIERAQIVIDEVRAISMNLRPAALDDLGAVSAIRSFCRDWCEVYNNVVVETSFAVSDKEIPASIITNVYRAVQESLNNVARHAQARRVWVSMRIEGSKLVVNIRDDGLGFAADGDERGERRTSTLLGLRGLRERTQCSGGCCKITSVPGKGTTVHLEWPIDRELPGPQARARLN